MKKENLNNKSEILDLYFCNKRPTEWIKQKIQIMTWKTLETLTKAHCDLN